MKDWRMEGWGRRERRRGEIISTGMIRHWDIPLVFGMKESHSSTYQHKYGVDYYCVCLAWTLVNNGSLYYSAVAGSINYNYNADNVHASFITGSWINFTVLFSLTRACKVTRVPHGGWLLVKRSFLRSGTRMCKARWIKSPATASDIDSQARLHITAAVNFLSLANVIISLHTGRPLYRHVPLYENSSWRIQSCLALNYFFSSLLLPPLSKIHGFMRIVTDVVAVISHCTELFHSLTRPTERRGWNVFWSSESCYVKPLTTHTEAETGRMHFCQCGFGCMIWQFIERVQRRSVLATRWIWT